MNILFAFSDEKEPDHCGGAAAIADPRDTPSRARSAWHPPERHQTQEASMAAGPSVTSLSGAPGPKQICGSAPDRHSKVVSQMCRSAHSYRSSRLSMPQRGPLKRPFVAVANWRSPRPSACRRFSPSWDTHQCQVQRILPKNSALYRCALLMPFVSQSTFYVLVLMGEPEQGGRKKYCHDAID